MKALIRSHIYMFVCMYKLNINFHKRIKSDLKKINYKLFNNFV